jgi:hypothetical protein
LYYSTTHLTSPSGSSGVVVVVVQGQPFATTLYNFTAVKLPAPERSSNDYHGYDVEKEKNICDASD